MSVELSMIRLKVKVDSLRPHGLLPTRLPHPWDFPGKSAGLDCQGRPLQPLFAAAAKSLQSCLTLYDPIDGSPPGSPIPGILQARILDWIAISFSTETLLNLFISSNKFLVESLEFFIHGIT